MVAASSFVYVAVADLIPQLQKRLSWRETVAQIFWLAAGLLMIASIVKFLGHDHESVPQSVPQPVGSDAGHHDEHGASH